VYVLGAVVLISSRLTLQKRGGEIVSNPERDPTMVQDLLTFKAKMDEILSKAFRDADIFRNALKVS
jgi:hypothetical protein